MMGIHCGSGDWHRGEEDRVGLDDCCCDDGFGLYLCLESDLYLEDFYLYIDLCLEGGLDLGLENDDSENDATIYEDDTVESHSFFPEFENVNLFPKVFEYMVQRMSSAW